MILEQTIEILPNRRLELDLPLELPVGRARVELRITPEKQEHHVGGETAFGCLNHFADPAKITGEKGSWERFILNKYEKN